MSATDVEQRDFLLACAAWQDTLLQSYRGLHVTMQGFFLAGGAAVAAVQLTGAIQEQSARPLATALFNLLFSALLLALFWLQRKTSSELSGVTSSRALDINFWHVEVILSENPLEPTQRKFTYFKRWQQAKRAAEHLDLDTYLPAGGVTRAVAEELVGKGIGHTRRVLDEHLFERLQAVWIGLCLASGAISGWFIFLWCAKAASSA